jgi:protein gp37
VQHDSFFQTLFDSSTDNRSDYISRMSDNSKIEWTDASWNPVRGCTKISPGCKHCYAETFAERFRGVEDHPYEQGFDLRLVPEKLTEPLIWNRPKMVFVNSMSDLFQEGVPTEYIKSVVDVMMVANWHIYQVLTKRSERMRDLLNSELDYAAQAPHIWWGASVEDQAYGVPRINHLRCTEVSVRFLSIEPLLENIGNLNLDGIHWVIVGGESGPGARPMQPEWVEQVLTQCLMADIPFFFKQWGGKQKSRTGRTLHDRTYDEMPTLVRHPFPTARAERIQLIQTLLDDQPEVHILPPGGPHARRRRNRLALSST